MKEEDGDGLTYSAKRIGRVCLSREDWTFRELSKIKGEHLESFARSFPAKKLSSFLTLKKRERTRTHLVFPWASEEVEREGLKKPYRIGQNWMSQVGIFLHIDLLRARSILCLPAKIKNKNQNLKQLGTKCYNVSMTWSQLRPERSQQKNKHLKRLICTYGSNKE